jgi:hypothetical protein
MCSRLVSFNVSDATNIINLFKVAAFGLASNLIDTFISLSVLLPAVFTNGDVSIAVVEFPAFHQILYST